MERTRTGNLPPDGVPDRAAAGQRLQIVGGRKTPALPCRLASCPFSVLDGAVAGAILFWGSAPAGCGPGSFSRKGGALKAGLSTREVGPGGIHEGHREDLHQPPAQEHEGVGDHRRGEGPVESRPGGHRMAAGTVRTDARRRRELAAQQRTCSTVKSLDEVGNSRVQSDNRAIIHSRKFADISAPVA